MTKKNAGVVIVCSLFLVAAPVCLAGEASPNIIASRVECFFEIARPGDRVEVYVTATAPEGIKEIGGLFNRSQHLKEGGKNEVMTTLKFLPTGEPDEFCASFTVPATVKGQPDQPLPAGGYRCSLKTYIDAKKQVHHHRSVPIAVWLFSGESGPAWELSAGPVDGAAPGKHGRLNVAIASRMPDRTRFLIEAVVSDYHRTWRASITRSLRLDPKTKGATPIELPTKGFGFCRVNLTVRRHDKVGRTEFRSLWTRAAARPEMVLGPYLLRVSGTQATVAWETKESSQGIVRFGRTRKMRGTAREDQPVRLHKVLLDGLKPGTLHRYRLISGQTEGPTYAFLTAPRADQPFRVGVASDMQSKRTGGHNGWDEGVKVFMEQEVQAVMVVGDLVEHSDSLEQWVGHFFRRAQDLLAHVPIYPIVGNHEIWPDYAKAHFFRYFDFPDRKAFYDFRYGNAHFVCLDSTWRGKSSWDPQWVENALEDDGAEWRFALFHHPPYSARPEPERGYKGGQAMLDVFAKYGVDIVFSGHFHSYERTYPMAGDKVDPFRGVVYLTLGGLGSPKSMTRNYPWALRANPGNDVVIMDVQGKTIHYRRLLQDGRLADSVTFTHDPAYLRTIIEELKSKRGRQGLEPLERLARLRGIRFSPQIQVVARKGIPVLIDLARNAQGPALRVAIAEALAALAPLDPDAIGKAARSLAQDASEQVRAASIQALSEAGTAEDLMPFLGAEDLHVRRAAVWGLVRCAAPPTKDRLWQIASSDKDPVVRHLAVQALDRLGDRATGAEFREALNRGEENSLFVLRTLERAAARRGIEVKTE